jgi:hypothetical protein
MSLARKERWVWGRPLKNREPSMSVVRKERWIWSTPLKSHEREHKRAKELPFCLLLAILSIHWPYLQQNHTLGVVPLFMWLALSSVYSSTNLRFCELGEEGMALCAIELSK